MKQKREPSDHFGTPRGHSREEVTSPRYHWDVQKLMRPFVILQWTHQGMGRIRFDQDEAIDLPPGQAFVCHSREPIQYWYPAEFQKPWIFSWIQFEGDTSHQLWADLRAQFGSVITIPEKSSAGLALDKLITRVQGKHFKDRLEESEECFAFYIRLWRQLIKPQESELGAMAYALEYCNKHYDEPMGVKELAARSNLSREHFSRLFKEQNKVSPATYLRELRLGAAMELLKSTTLPLKEIATRAGFYSAAQLSQLVRQKSKQTPQQVRRNLRRGKSS